MLSGLLKTVFLFSTSTPSPSSSSAAGATKSGSSKAGIIAGPIAAVLAIIGMVVGFLFWRRHRNRNRVKRPLYLDAEIIPFPNSYGVAPSESPHDGTADNVSMTAFPTEKRPFMTASGTSSPAVSIYNHGATAKSDTSARHTSIRALPTPPLPPGLARTESDATSSQSHSASNAHVDSQIATSDVNRILELISQGMGPPEAGVPPPQYSG